jgi:hypothetical protein
LLTRALLSKSSQSRQYAAVWEWQLQCLVLPPRNK